MYALFKEGKQVSKVHSTRHAIIIEAFERGVVFSSRPDFGPGFEKRIDICNGFEIREVETPPEREQLKAGNAAAKTEADKRGYESHPKMSEIGDEK